jgi:hypothetical protein
MTPMIVAIWIAGGIQLALALANLEVARKLDYRANLAKLTPMVGQIFRAHAVYSVLIILWFGALCLFFCGTAGESRPARPIPDRRPRGVLGPSGHHPADRVRQEGAQRLPASGRCIPGRMHLVDRRLPRRGGALR